MTQTIDTPTDTRRFRTYEYNGRFYIREWSVSASMGVLGRTRQSAWDKARAQLLPVTFISVDGVEKNLGVVASELVKVTMTEAAWKIANAPVSTAINTGPVCYTKKTTAEVGVYQVGDQVYRVIWNQANTRRYAQLLVILPNGKSRWDYNGGFGKVYDLTPAQRMTKEQAKKFGDTYHFCACCRKKLTVKLSIERGIGPICWEKYGFSD